ncbi:MULTISPECIES: DUF4035 domain-containing protein [Enterobacter]|uniref:phage tail assembly protein T n=1 Tax=Enterobacter TaxID=547 RepID=UPI000668BFF4|nr:MULTISPECIES: DUF4035 domain-containing protein [Enterobacter]HDR2790983.1 DUF4035 domain-containing protein [Enterobacter asburiae]MCR1319870.1 DUF4035 domain-containing protein [Enterobacter soli]QMR77829.1 DUF4035 domain-containing protein [Enterobacter sp. RHBSTW-00175]HDR2807249.1 DUF4035 domain-containing protein [Enterobacter asburiae]HDR2812650.1 DUF4035 domain-containing protein [Enterobacter asburiae]
MSLALRMGRTLSELRQSMTASELLMWIEFDRQSPVGDIRGDIQAAQIVSAIYGSQGAKVQLDDAILRWGDGEQSAPKDPFAALEAALTVATQ